MLRTRVFPQYRDHGVGRWAVVLKETGEAIGWCGLKWVAEAREYDLGYRFFEPHWGRGYATESARAVLAWGRARFPRARIVGKAHGDNLASLHVLEKLGLRFERHEDDPDGRIAVYVA